MCKGKQGMWAVGLRREVVIGVGRGGVWQGGVQGAAWRWGGTRDGRAPEVTEPEGQKGIELLLR